MSVLPTGYGHGKPRVYGEYKVLCTDVGYYACGYRFMVKKVCVNTIEKTSN
jgi:hypothetical protein